MRVRLTALCRRPDTLFSGILMRIGLFADLHANREALEACLQHARSQQIDRYAFLGDLVGYGADPEWVLDTVMHHQERGAIVVLGNHDEAVFAERDRTMHDDAQDAIEWTRDRISARHLMYLRMLPQKVEFSDTLFVHANAWAPGGWQYLTELGDASRSLAATLCRFTVCGHVHQTHLYHQGATGRIVPFKPVAGVDVPLGVHRRWLVVLGSVGQPRDRNPAACYAVLDRPRNLLTVHRVPYDVDKAAKKIRDARLPDWLGMRLEQGV